jgi:hypothetical protein
MCRSKAASFNVTAAAAKRAFWQLPQLGAATRSALFRRLTVKRNKGVGTMHLFGSLRGTKYTKDGWKASLDDLMRPCAVEAEK